MNIVEFKMKLVENLVGRSIDNLFDSKGGGGEQHTPVHIERWATVAVCILCNNV
jgi:hypothetical protein